MAGTERMSVAQARELLGKGLGQGGRAGGRVARGKHTPGEMNDLERDYEAEVLKPALLGGDILWYAFEAVKLKLAPKTFLTIDFFVMTGAGELEARETKGFMEEDAAVKLKVAAAMFPFRFKLIKRAAKQDGGWKVTAYE